MSIENSNPETTFRVFLQDDSTYAIEISIPDSSPTKVTSFTSEENAQHWIDNYKSRVDIIRTQGKRSFRSRSAEQANRKV